MFDSQKKGYLFYGTQFCRLALHPGNGESVLI